MAITINGNGTVSGITAGLTASSMPAGSILQVKGAFLKEPFDTTSTTLVDITGLSVDITMTSASNQVVVMFSVDASNGGAGSSHRTIRLAVLRGTTNLLGTSPVSNRIRGWQLGNFGDENVGESASCQFLDTPGTGTHTYKLQMAAQSNTGYINQSGSDSDNATYGYRSGSSIVVMEVAV